MVMNMKHTELTFIYQKKVHLLVFMLMNYLYVLSIEKEQIKVFMSSAFYSYQDDSDYIIKNGEFDFSKYKSIDL